MVVIQNDTYMEYQLLGNGGESGIHFTKDLNEVFCILSD